MKNSNNHTIVELREIPNSKNALTKLDEYNHEFIDVVLYNGNALFIF